MAYNDDLPFYTNVNGKKWLVVPYSLEVNDTRFWRGGMTTPNDFYESMRGVNHTSGKPRAYSRKFCRAITLLARWTPDT